MLTLKMEVHKLGKDAYQLQEFQIKLSKIQCRFGIVQDSLMFGDIHEISNSFYNLKLMENIG